MIEKKMIVDPDHLSVLARDQVMSQLEAAHYSGVISSHSWSTADSFPRIYRLGGLVTPYAGASETFVKAWQQLRPMRDPKYYWGLGWGADMNGFGAQGGPRLGASNPVRYPFKSFDGKMTIDRERTGQRVFDINTDGVAQYGLFPDWVQDLRMIAGDQIVKDLSRGPEAYLQMWERAEGVPVAHCQAARAPFTPAGLGQMRLGAGSDTLLRSAGQPDQRPGRAWRYCVQGRSPASSAVVTVLTPGGSLALVASSARGHRARGIGPGGSVRRLGTPRRFKRGIVVRRAGAHSSYVYGVRGGRVRWVAVATRAAGTRAAQLKPYLRLAGLR